MAALEPALPKPVAPGALAPAVPLWVGPALVMATLLPATIVIPVIRRFVDAGWPEQEWAVHAFMAVSLAGACLVGPWAAALAEARGQRRAFAAGLAALDGLTLLGVAAMPPLWPMLALRFVQGGASVGAVSLLMGGLRSQARTPGQMGLVGSAVVMALVVAIPLGAVLGKVDPALPLLVGGLTGLVAAVLVALVLPLDTGVAASHTPLWRTLRLPALQGPVLAVALERFAVGCITVTLQLYASSVLGVEGRVSGWLTAFLLSFAVATYPSTRLTRAPWRAMAWGALVYGVVLASLPVVPAPAMAAWLMLGGFGSALVYGPGLTLAAQAVSPESRGSAMALMNAAGTLAMFLGTSLAGLLSQGLLGAGLSRAVAYGAVFTVAGASQLLTVLLAFRARPR